MSKNIQYGNLDPYFNQTVRIYWNLHQRMYSIQAKVDGKWKVVRHTVHAILDNATTYVSQAGRERVLRDYRKNVHAYVIGTLRAPDTSVRLDGMNYVSCRLTYNPYKHDNFVLDFADYYTPIPQSNCTVYFNRTLFNNQYHPDLRAVVLAQFAERFCSIS